MIWTSVKQAHPRPHAKYLVRRDEGLSVATPCYGLHEPLWVPGSFSTESVPIRMLETDEWVALS